MGVSYSFKFNDPNLGYMEQDYRLFGTNCFCLGGKISGPDGDIELTTMWCSGPVPTNCTRGWLVVATPSVGANKQEQQQIDGILDMGIQFAMGLAAEDEPIIANIRFRDQCLTRFDGAFSRYLDYLRKYPRAHPSQAFIT